MIDCVTYVCVFCIWCSIQAYLFPLLVGDDDKPVEYRERHLDNPDANVDGITARSMPMKGEAGPQHHTLSSGGVLKDTPATHSSLISCISKPVHERKRGVGQLCRAHHALSLRCTTEGSRIRGGVEAFFADQDTEPSGYGNIQGRCNALGSDGKPFASEPFETNATSMVDRAGTVLSTSSGNNPGDGCGASPPKYSELQQHPCSATSSRASSPRVSHTPVQSSFRDDGNARLENVNGSGLSTPMSRRSYSAGSKDFREDGRARGVYVEGEYERQEGILLQGPQGGVEVRQMNEGIFVVRRSVSEKRRSPEKLHLHGRQLKSCPLIQVRPQQTLF